MKVYVAIFSVRTQICCATSTADRDPRGRNLKTGDPSLRDQYDLRYACCGILDAALV